VLDKSSLYFEAISEVVNTYCIENSAICCRSLQQEPTSIGRSARHDITTSENVNFASGYPREFANLFSSKTIVTTTTFDMAELCNAELNKSGMREIYVSPSVLLNAVFRGQSYIENKLGVVIVFIDSPSKVEL